MRANKKTQKEDFKPQFKNTRSKFYHKFASFDKDFENESNPNSGNSGAFWKQKGNEFFKLQNYD